ncbi:MAG: type II secretion system protein [Kiritimatiellia bacterium]
MRLRKTGFTIVEMLMVIAVLSILAGIITTAASSAIKNARSRRADAMKQTLKNGIGVYYQQKGEWPGALKSLSENGSGSEKVFLLTSQQAQSVFREVAEESLKSGANSMMDVTGLFVSRSAGTDESGKGTGMDFTTAKKGDKGRKAITSVSQMYFGYPDTKTGFFRSYWIDYNTETDSINVLTLSEKQNNVNDKKYTNKN